MKVFDRAPNLNGNQIINYKADPSEKWLVLVGIAPGAPEVRAAAGAGFLSLYALAASPRGEEGPTPLPHECGPRPLPFLFCSSLPVLPFPSPPTAPRAREGQPAAVQRGAAAQPVAGGARRRLRLLHGAGGARQVAGRGGGGRGPHHVYGASDGDGDASMRGQAACVRDPACRPP